MAADLHLHIRTDDLTEQDFEIFFGNVLGSKYFNIARNERWQDKYELGVLDKINKTPNIWIGEVSWLKAAFFEDGEKNFIPNAVMKINEIVGEDQPIIDDKLIENIINAFSLNNETNYRLAKPHDVWAWLQIYKGKPVFCISW